MAAIWTHPVDLDALNEMSRNTAVAHLGIRFSAFGDDWLAAEMSVDDRTVQPMRILHGGVSVVLAESVGSTAANLCLRSSTQRAVGAEVNARTVQPMGILHGGVSVALAETVGSTASYLCIDESLWRAVGIEINANHLRMARSGLVTGTARPLSLGSRLQVWEIRITQDVTLVCISRLTMAVLDGARGAQRPASPP